jgi:lipopolysaccharide transport system ATP-binding protein
MLKTTMGHAVGGGMYPDIMQGGPLMVAGQVARISLEFSCNLNPGTYFVNCALSEHQSNIHRVVDAVAFKVLPTDRSFSFGIVDFNFGAKFELESSSPLHNT